MEIFNTQISGLILFKYKKYIDDRGFFYELYNKNNLHNYLKTNFVQDNLSFSKKNVLRGLHYQKNKPQAKLISVIEGEILDVVVDLRKNSNTFGFFEKFKLSSKNQKQLYIPENFAHGFLALSDYVILNYKCSNYYDPKDQETIIWNDSSLKIDWEINDPILSDKDKLGKFFKNLF